jgi:hypothetical protein
MDALTPDAIGQIALDRRRTALAGAQAHRLTRRVGRWRAWAGELRIAMDALHRRGSRERPPAAVARSTPSA